MKKSIATVILIAAGMFANTSAYALCAVNEQIVERVLSYGTYGYVYFRPKSSLTNSTYHYMRTTSDKILSLAGDAQTNRSVVTAVGNASTCPTTGTGRYMGEATYLYLLN